MPIPCSMSKPLCLLPQPTFAAHSLLNEQTFATTWLLELSIFGRPILPWTLLTHQGWLSTKGAVADLPTDRIGSGVSILTQLTLSPFPHKAHSFSLPISG